MLYTYGGDRNSYINLLVTVNFLRILFRNFSDVIPVTMLNSNSDNLTADE